MSDEANEPWFEIERTLRDDTQGLERDRLRSRLREAAQGVKRALDVGVPAAEFSRLEAIRKGLEAGDGTVELLWNRYHPTP